MGIVEKLFKQNVKESKESKFLDYKRNIECINDNIDLLKDINAFANNDYIGPLYIVYGVGENNGELEALGIDDSFNVLKDEASYQELVSNKIEPRIEISLYREEYEEKKYQILEINADKNQRPFMIRVDYQVDKKRIFKGDAWIREGSRKDRMNRKDFDNIYFTKIPPLDVILTDHELFITDDEPGNLEMVIKNHSPINRLYTDVFFVVFDDKGNERISTKMYGFKTYDELQIGTFDMDFSLRVPGSTELEGIGKFNLTTSQVALLGVDEFGCSDIKYTFKLYFRDSVKIQNLCLMIVLSLLKKV